MKKTTKAMLKLSQFECIICNSTSLSEKPRQCNDCGGPMKKFISSFKFRSHTNPYKFTNLSSNDDENHTMLCMNVLELK